jgi:hypothetical protein
VTGKHYAESAEVTYRQPYWIEGTQKKEEREATLHLVRANGAWRWFLGTDPAWINQLPESC